MTTGLISHIQGYCTKDGPGIRTTVFMMECNLRCVWCSNPEAMLPGKKILYHVNKCRRCGTCATIANDHSIVVDSDGCHIDRARCINLHQVSDRCVNDAFENKGTEWTPVQLYERLKRDRDFYIMSDGGVTFSGGEPTLQRDFVLKTVNLLKADGIHVALDTAGLFDFEKTKPLLEAVDLVLYDIKAWDPTLHKQCTGVDNREILKNAQNIAQMGKPMIVRMVMVPTVNDDFDDITKRLQFIKSLGPSVKQVDLLNYHRLGLGKYRALQLNYPLEDLAEADQAWILKIQEISHDLGLTTTIGG